MLLLISYLILQILKILPLIVKCELLLCTLDITDVDFYFYRDDQKIVLKSVRDKSLPFLGLTFKLEVRTTACELNIHKQ